MIFERFFLVFEYNERKLICMVLFLFFLDELFENVVECENVD